jgi:hypothetical protein
MPVELWIILGLAVTGAAVALARRLLGSPRRGRSKEPKNVYPLW